MGVCISDRNGVLRHSPLWEEKLADNQLILLSIQYKSPRENRTGGAVGEGSGRRGEARQTRGPRGPCLPPLGRSGAGDITMEQRVNGPHS